MERTGTNSMKAWALEKSVVPQLVKEFLSLYASLIFNGHFLKKSLLSSTHRSLYPRGQSDVKLTTDLYLLLKLRIMDLYFHSSVYVRDIVPNIIPYSLKKTGIILRTSAE